MAASPMAAAASATSHTRICFFRSIACLLFYIFRKPDEQAFGRRGETGPILYVRNELLRVSVWIDPPFSHEGIYRKMRRGPAVNPDSLQFSYMKARFEELSQFTFG
jgi:hypothetical protein